MEEKIWNYDEEWSTNEYNRRLSEENKLLLQQEEEMDELKEENEMRIKELEEKHKSQVKKIWEKRDKFS